MSKHSHANHRPKLRDNLAAQPHQQGNLLLHDPCRIGRPVVLSPLAAEVAQRFDGESTLTEIVVAVTQEFPGVEVSVEVLVGLVEALDEAALLDSPTLLARFSGPVRKPVCFEPGANPAALRAELEQLFTADGGPGLPELPEDLGTLEREERNSPPPAARRLAATSPTRGEVEELTSPLVGEVALPTAKRVGGDCLGLHNPPPHGSQEKLRAVLAPHMDYGRGNVTYGHAFAELIRNTDARVFVIVATSHYSGHRFTLSRQNFETPLGVAETDQEYVNRIVEHYGDGLFADPLAHVPEHSIELEVALLQFLLTDRRPFKIVPLLTGSIHDCMNRKSDPASAADLSRMVGALRAAEAACPESVCYIISGDLAHIGPKFGDKRKAEGPWLEESRAKDADILKSLERATAGAFFDTIAAEQNKRRICGLSPTWLTLETIKPRTGKVLHYQQFVHPQGNESVSFAAAAFYA